jgi:hypothetical protein
MPWRMPEKNIGKWDTSEDGDEGQEGIYIYASADAEDEIGTNGTLAPFRHTYSKSQLPFPALLNSGRRIQDGWRYNFSPDYRAFRRSLSIPSSPL